MVNYISNAAMPIIILLIVGYGLKEKIKVYYTNISFNKIKNANQNELKNIIEQSNLMVEN